MIETLLNWIGALILLYFIILIFLKFNRGYSWHEAHEKIAPTPKFTLIKKMLKKNSMLSSALALSYFIIYALICFYLIEHYEFLGFVAAAIIWILTAERFDKFMSKLDKKDNE